MIDSYLNKKQKASIAALSVLVMVWLPVSVDAAGIDVVRSLHSSDWLQAHPRGLERHDIDQSVLELVAGQVGADES